MNTIKFRLGGGSDPGCVRTNNEDNFVANADLSGNEWYLPQDQNKELHLGEKGCLLVVADGMGGMNAGEVASDIAVKTVEECFASDRITAAVLRNESSIESFMKEAIVTADKRIKEKSREDRSTEGMGTTIVIAWLLQNKIYVAWCGDSRAYYFHPDTGLRQLSKDHSYVQELIDSGKLEAQYAFDHPDSNIITRSLGDPRQTAHPDFVSATLYNEEIILLCSDGLSGMIRDEQTEEILCRCGNDMVGCKEALIEGARSAGGHDNITVMMCRIMSGGSDLPVSMYRENGEKSSEKICSPVQPAMQKSFVRRVGMAKLGLLIVLLLLLAAAAGWYFGRKSAEKSDKPKAEVEQPGPVSGGEETESDTPTQNPVSSSENKDKDASVDKKNPPVAEESVSVKDDHCVLDKEKNKDRRENEESAGRSSNVSQNSRTEPPTIDPAAGLTPVLEGEIPVGEDRELNPAQETVLQNDDVSKKDTDGNKYRKKEKTQEVNKSGEVSEGNIAKEEKENN